MGTCVAAVVIFVITQILVIGLLTALAQTESRIDESRLNPLQGILALFLLLLILAWTSIAFGEALFYRAFLISRLVDTAGLGHAPTILISALLFGAAHSAEGPVDLFSNGSIGLLFGWIYLRSSRNLWITIVAHGQINTTRFTLLYFGMV
jgi:membrane protease YdiL (CAAX protease family)